MYSARTTCPMDLRGRRPPDLENHPLQCCRHWPSAQTESVPSWVNGTARVIGRRRREGISPIPANLAPELSLAARLGIQAAELSGKFWRRERDSNLAESCAASITYELQKTFCPLQSPRLPGFGSRFGNSFAQRFRIATQPEDARRVDPLCLYLFITTDVSYRPRPEETSALPNLGIAALDCLVARHTLNDHDSTADHGRHPAECHSDFSNPLQTWVYRSG